MNLSHSATGRSRNGVGTNPGGMPALFTSTSTGPSALSTSPTMRVTASRSVTSAGTAIARPPAPAMPAATASARSGTRSFTATAAPCADSAAAIPAPMPCPAPVTSAVRPWRSNITG